MFRRALLASASATSGRPTRNSGSPTDPPTSESSPRPAGAPRGGPRTRLAELRADLLTY